MSNKGTELFDANASSDDVVIFHLAPLTEGEDVKYEFAAHAPFYMGRFNDTENDMAKSIVSTDDILNLIASSEIGYTFVACGVNVKLIKITLQKA